MGKKQKHGQEIARQFFINHGYDTDHYGNQKSPNGQYRAHYNQLKLRYERKVSNGWMRVYSVFYRDISDFSFDLRISVGDRDDSRSLALP